MIVTGWGLGIRSALPIPGAIETPTDQAESIVVDFGRPDDWTATEEWGPYRVRDADLFDFTMEGIGTFTCRDRRRVSIAPAGGAEEADIAAMLIATALPALLWARGEVLIHSSAISRAGLPGTLVAGPSGSGKSAALGAAVSKGMHAIGDDSVRLRLDEGHLLASGLPAGRWTRTASDGEERVFVPISASQILGESEVDRLAIMNVDGQKRLRLDRQQIFVELWRHRHRPRITQMLRTEKSFVPIFAAMSAHLNGHTLPVRGY